MILTKIKIVETYPNGKIKYVETICTISKLWAALYPNRRVSNDGTFWIRTGANEKFDRNGNLRWRLMYDEFGNIKK